MTRRAQPLAAIAVTSTRMPSTANDATPTAARTGQGFGEEAFVDLVECGAIGHVGEVDRQVHDPVHGAARIVLAWPEPGRGWLAAESCYYRAS